MSRSTRDLEIKTPCTRYFKWKGSEGGFSYFDKAKGEKGENIEVKAPFRFIVLDMLTTIKGWSDADESSYYSNEVRDIKKGILKVRTKKGLQAEGTYEEIKAKLGSAGADFCQSVYIAYYDENKEMQIGNIAMMGAALGSWFDFCKKHKVMDIAVSVNGALDAKKGATKYKVPIFDILTISPDADAKATELDKVLQDYLKAYFIQQNTPQEEEKLSDKYPAQNEYPTHSSVDQEEIQIESELERVRKEATKPFVDEEGDMLPF